MGRERIVVLALLAFGAIAGSAGGASTGLSPSLMAPGQNPPALTTLPSISGTFFGGQTLTAAPGQWGGPTQTYAFQWARCNSSGACSPIAEAAAQAYTLVAADVGSTIRVTVTASNKIGSTLATSEATSVVVATTTTSTTTPTQTTTTTPSTTTPSTTTPSTTTTSPTTTTPSAGSPYWRGDFTNADYCPAWDSVFESATVNSLGFYDPCQDTTVSPTSGSRRVYLSQAAGHPSSTSSPWASHQEIRTTDAGWGGDLSLDKSSLSMTSARTFNGSYAMGTTRWFRFSFYLPNGTPSGEQFNWPVNDWNLLANVHVSRDGAGDCQDLKVQPWSGNQRYLTWVLEGASSGDASQWEYINVLQLTDGSGNRISNAFNSWHTTIIGVTFSDQGTIGSSPGHLTIIFDGQTVYDKARPTARTGETGPWFQLQNYKSHTSSFVNGASSSTIYYADARIGYSRADVSG